MISPGRNFVQTFLSNCTGSMASITLRAVVARCLFGFAILITTMIPSALAAPQSDTRDATIPGSPETPNFRPDVGHGTPATRDALIGKLVATPSSVDFVSVPIGLTYSQTISLKNTGTATVLLSHASISAVGFKLTGLAAVRTISPGQNVTFNVTFRPSTTSTITGAATIFSSASDSQMVIQLTGTGTVSTASLGASPISLRFGSVTIGEADTLPVTLTNTGNVNVTINSVSLPNSLFTTSGASAGTILAPSQSATLQITYAPTSASSTNGNVAISSSASNSPLNIAVTGSGLQSAQQSVSLGWVGSTTPGVVGYFVYRGKVSGGPYTMLNSSYVSTTKYTDSTVQPSTTYYYVVTSVNSSNMQSGYSAQVSAKVPAE
jgi:hypothetical protein